MKKLTLPLLVLLLLAVISIPWVKTMASIRALEDKVQSDVQGKNLKELPDTWQLRIPDTDWFLAGYSCPYSEHPYTLTPGFAIPGNWTLSNDNEGKNALFFLNVQRQVTYVLFDRRDLDFCGVDSVKPNIPIID
jgi:hypothetical protein